MPATTIQLSTTGVDTSAPVVVKLSNSAGFDVAETSISVHSDGSVVAAVPIYFDPVTGNEGNGTVSVAISQNGQTSSPFPTPVNIQALPNNASSLPLRQITRAFLNYQAVKIGRRLKVTGKFRSSWNNSRLQCSLEFPTGNVEKRHRLQFRHHRCRRKTRSAV
jgi:hypothetical protein